MYIRTYTVHLCACVYWPGKHVVNWLAGCLESWFHCQANLIPTGQPQCPVWGGGSSGHHSKITPLARSVCLSVCLSVYVALLPFDCMLRTLGSPQILESVPGKFSGVAFHFSFVPKHYTCKVRFIIMFWPGWFPFASCLLLLDFHVELFACLLISFFTKRKHIPRASEQPAVVSIFLEHSTPNCKVKLHTYTGRLTDCSILYWKWLHSCIEFISHPLSSRQTEALLLSTHSSAASGLSQL